MKRLLLAIGCSALLALGGCDYLKAAGTVSSAASTPVGVKTVNDARNIAFAIDSMYTATLPFATIYVKRPPCSVAPAPPLCSDTDAVRTLADLQRKVSAAVNRLDALALSASPDMSVLSAAVTAAREAFAGYQDFMIAKGMGGK